MNKKFELLREAVGCYKANHVSGDTNEKALLEFIDELEQLTIPLVVGQSEQLKTFNCISLVDGFDPCKEQCLYCRDVKGF
jgi:hypothetical protein